MGGRVYVQPMTTATADLTDLLTAADLPWHLSRWGVPSITFPDGEHTIRVTQDEGTFYLVVLSDGKAQLIHTEVRFSGVAAQAALLATIDALMVELA